MIIDRYIQYISSVRRYSPRTCEIYGEVLHDFAVYTLGTGEFSDEDLLAAMTPNRMRNYEVWLLDGKGLGARTVNLHLSVLSGFSRFLVREKLIQANPVRQISRPKQEKRLPEFYRQDAMEKYLADTAYRMEPDYLKLLSGGDKVAKEAYEAILARMIISVLYCTGIRRSELISLTIGALDTSRGVLHVRGKGDKMREIPIIFSLSQELFLYLQATAELTAGGRASDDPLFVTFRGGKLYPVYVDRTVKAELGSTGEITGRKSPHVLRHTLATELLDDGADLNSIKELLGHSSLAATQVYTHNSVEKLQRVYNNAHPRAKRGGKNGD